MNDLSRRSRSGGFFRFVAAFGLVGSVSGTIAGGSVEGLVGAVFATILGLVSSLLGYLFSRESLSQWRPVIPLAISSLLVNSLLGLSIGGVKRVQREINMVEIRKAESEFKEVYLPVEKQRRLDMVQKCIGELPLEEAIQACK